MWFPAIDGQGAGQEIRWLLEKGVTEFVVWSGTPVVMPVGGRYFSRRRGTPDGCPQWVKWKITEIERHASLDGHS